MWTIWAKMEKYLIFPWLSKEVCANGPQIVGRPLITYFDQKFSLVIRI